MDSPSVAIVPSETRSLETLFQGYQRLSVRQRKRWMEILLSFEMKNSYDVHNESGMPVFRVRELGNGFLSLLKRIFLGPVRPFAAEVIDLATEKILFLLRRPFRFFFHRLEVRTGGGEFWGAIERRWSWLRRLYDVQDANGRVVAQLFGPILKPWTFEIQVDGVTAGTIRKRWSGLGKEMFTDADNFGVDLSGLSDPRLKALAFAATVLIDMVHFERAKG